MGYTLYIEVGVPGGGLSLLYISIAYYMKKKKKKKKGGGGPDNM